MWRTWQSDEINELKRDRYKTDRGKGKEQARRREEREKETLLVNQDWLAAVKTRNSWQHCALLKPNCTARWWCVVQSVKQRWVRKTRVRAASTRQSETSIPSGPDCTALPTTGHSIRSVPFPSHLAMSKKFARLSISRTEGWTMLTPLPAYRSSLHLTLHSHPVQTTNASLCN